MRPTCKTLKYFYAFQPEKETNERVKNFKKATLGRVHWWCIQFIHLFVSWN